jgi:DNA (cytosine-5)-methyltransferase 1
MLEQTHVASSPSSRRGRQCVLPLFDVPPPRPVADARPWRFADLFAGIGGLRQGFEAAGGHCVFTSEWSLQAQKTYSENFDVSHGLAGDITKVEADGIPDHDVLVAGFPCQPFSIAGVSKKNSLGRAHGFEDETQGTLFFDVCRIIAAKRPAAFLLENVKNLMSHDKGRTFKVIERSLRDLGYRATSRVIDAAHFGPQHRERILIAGFRNDLDVEFSWDSKELPDKGGILMRDILHKTDGSEPRLPWDNDKYFDAESRSVNFRYTLTDKLWQYLKDYAEKHRAKGNGFGFGLVGLDSRCRTLSARYYKDGSEILIDQGTEMNPRRLTPRECARLMGFPDTFRIPVADTQAYKQFGNSVVVGVARHAANAMLPYLQDALSRAGGMPNAEVGGLAR